MVTAHGLKGPDARDPMAMATGERCRPGHEPARHFSRQAREFPLIGLEPRRD